MTNLETSLIAYLKTLPIITDALGSGDALRLFPEVIPDHPGGDPAAAYQLIDSTPDSPSFQPAPETGLKDADYGDSIIQLTFWGRSRSAVMALTSYCRAHFHSYYGAMASTHVGNCIAQIGPSQWDKTTQNHGSTISLTFSHRDI